MKPISGSRPTSALLHLVKLRLKPTRRAGDSSSPLVAERPAVVVAGRSWTDSVQLTGNAYLAPRINAASVLFDDVADSNLIKYYFGRRARRTPTSYQPTTFHPPAQRDCGERSIDQAPDLG